MMRVRRGCQRCPNRFSAAGGAAGAMVSDADTSYERMSAASGCSSSGSECRRKAVVRLWNGRSSSDGTVCTMGLPAALKTGAGTPDDLMPGGEGNGYFEWRGFESRRWSAMAGVAQR